MPCKVSHCNDADQLTVLHYRETAYLVVHHPLHRDFDWHLRVGSRQYLGHDVTYFYLRDRQLLGAYLFDKVPFAHDPHGIPIPYHKHRADALLRHYHGSLQRRLVMVYHDYLLCHDVTNYGSCHTNFSESVEDKNNAVVNDIPDVKFANLKILIRALSSSTRSNGEDWNCCFPRQ